MDMDKKKGVTIQKIVFIFFLITILIYSVMSRIMGLRELFSIIVLITIYYLMRRNETPFDLEFLFLFGTFLLVGIYEYIYDPFLSFKYSPIVYAWIYPTVYILAKTCIGESKEYNQNKSFLILSIITIGMFIQGVLNYACKLVCNPGLPLNETAWETIWNGEILNKNEINFEFIMAIGAFFFAYIVRKEKKQLFKTVVIANVFVIAVSFLVGGRTALLMFVGIFVFSVLVNITVDFHKIKDEKTLILPICIMVFFLALIITALVLLLGKDWLSRSYWGRDGGIIHNIRIQWALEGLEKIYVNQYGGWFVESNEFSGKTHNALLEYGRNYDVVIFSLLTIYLILSLIKGLWALVKRGKNIPILYYLINCQILFLAYYILEPTAFNYQDELVIYIFLSGITSGIVQNECKCDIKSNKLCKIFSFRYRDIGFLFLSVTLTIVAYYDWRMYRLNFIVTIVPIILYVLPMLIRDDRLRFVLAVILELMLTIYTFEKEKVEGVLNNINMVTLLILPMALVIGYLFYRIRLNKKYLTLITAIICLPYAWIYIHDGRLNTILKALTLTFSNEGIISWNCLSVEKIGWSTSRCMWLEYARNYGFLIFAMLMIFAIYSCFLLIEMYKKFSYSWIEYICFISFIFFNINYMVDEMAYAHKSLWCLGVLTTGVMRSLVYKKET